MYYEQKISPSMLERKRLDFGLDIKSIDGAGRFTGYASVFDVVDSQRDVILRGAFSETLSGRIGEIKLLWQHSSAEPIGVFDVIAEDEKGLYVEGRLLLDVQRAREAYALLKAGAIQGLSIGYSPLRYTIDDDTGVRLLASVQLWEVSLVTFPANDQANIRVVKQEMPEREWREASAPGRIIALADALDRAIGVLRS